MKRFSYLATLLWVMQIASNVFGQEVDASLTILPELQQAGGLIVSGESNAPRGLEITVTVADRFIGTIVDSTTSRVLAKGEYKTKRFCKNKKRGILTPGKYYVVVTIELGEQSFGNSLSKKLGKRIADRMTGLQVWGDESGRFVTNLVSFTVGGKADVARQLKAAQALAIEYKQIQEEFKLLKSREKKARQGFQKLKTIPPPDDAPTRQELQDFVKHSSELIGQLEKRITAIEHEQVREILEIQASDFKGLKGNVGRNAGQRNKTELPPLVSASKYRYDLEHLMLRAELELENDGFLNLTDSEGKQNITARVFTRHAKHKGGVFLQSRNGLTKFYPYNKFDRASQAKLNSPIYVDNHLVVFTRRHRSR